jgi:hypothetical protein
VDTRVATAAKAALAALQDTAAACAAVLFTKGSVEAVCIAVVGLVVVVVVVGAVVVVELIGLVLEVSKEEESALLAPASWGNMRFNFKSPRKCFGVSVNAFIRESFFEDTESLLRWES